MAKPDKNYRSYADVKNVYVNKETLIPEVDDSDTLKLSNADNVNVTLCEIHGGKEDCIDINRDCSFVKIVDTRLAPKGKYGITAKGGSYQITLTNVIFLSHGTEYDIDIGNWSDQNQNPTTGVTLNNVYATDGKPVRVRVLWGDKPTVIGGNVKITVYPKCLVKLYRWLRKRNLVS